MGLDFNDTRFGLAQIKKEGGETIYDSGRYTADSFDEFIDGLEFKFGTRWLRPIMLPFLECAWGSGRMAERRKQEEEESNEDR